MTHASRDREHRHRVAARRDDAAALPRPSPAAYFSWTGGPFPAAAAALAIRDYDGALGRWGAVEAGNGPEPGGVGREGRSNRVLGQRFVDLVTAFG